MFYFIKSVLFKTTIKLLYWWFMSDWNYFIRLEMCYFLQSFFFSILRSLYMKWQLQFLRWNLPFKGHSHVCENFVKMPLGYLSCWLHFKWEKEDYKGTSWCLYFLTHNFHIQMIFYRSLSSHLEKFYSCGNFKVLITGEKHAYGIHANILSGPLTNLQWRYPFVLP